MRPLSPRLRGGVQEAADDGEQLRLVEQEGVVALVAVDLGERDARRRRRSAHARWRAIPRSGTASRW